MKIIQSTILIVAEFIMLSIAIIWFKRTDEFEEPLILIISSITALIITITALIISISTRRINANKNISIKGYCEVLLKIINPIRLPLPTNLGFTKNVDLEDVYIDLTLEVIYERMIPSKFDEGQKLISKSSYFQTIDSGELERDLGESGIKKNIKIEEENIGDILEKNQNLIVTGDRGSGKSTLLKRIASGYATKQVKSSIWKKHKEIGLPDKPIIPLMINCSELEREVDHSNLVEILRLQLNLILQNKEWVDNIWVKLQPKLKNGKVLLLVDGLDELDQHQQEQLCNGIMSFKKIYPKVSVVISTLSFGFNAVTRFLGDGFQLVRIKSLSLKDKQEFIKKWVKNIDRHNNTPEFIENLQSEINSSYQVTRLANNIQVLTLLVQIRNLIEFIPRHTNEILRSTFNLLFQRAETSPGKRLLENEAMLQLEAISFYMWESKVNALTEVEIIQTLNLLKKEYPGEIVANWKSPEVFLKTIVNNTGILILNKSINDKNGVNHNYYQFYHQTFKDYFLAQAINHNDKLKDLVSDLEFREQPVLGVENMELTESVLSESSQYPLKMLASELSPSDAEALLYGILFPSGKIKSGDKKARSVFAGDILSSEIDVSNEVAKVTIGSLLEHMDSKVDGKNTIPKNNFQRVIQNLANSRWKYILQDLLVDMYIKSRGIRRSAFGSIISLNLIENPIVTEQPLSIDALLSSPINLDVSKEARQVFESIKIMTFAYNGINQSGKYSDKDLVKIQKILDQQLSFSGRKEGAQVAAIWAAGWLLQAKLLDRKIPLFIQQNHIDTIVKFISNPNNDSHALYWACLSLTCFKGNQQQPDWIYEWAQVADGLKPLKEIAPPVKNKCDLKITKALNSVLEQEYHLIAKEGAALALGRLGVYQKPATDSLFAVFLDDTLSDRTRGEAIGFLAQIEDRKIEERIFEIYRNAEDIEKNILKSYSFLALLGIGNLSRLENLVVNGKTEVGVPGDRVAATYALKTHQDQGNAGKRLSKLKNHPNPEISVLVQRILEPNKKVKAGLLKKLLLGSPSETEAKTPEELSEQTVAILLVRGEDKDDGLPLFAYVAVRVDRIEEFMEAQSSDLFYPEDYGVIIESGKGKPSQEIRKKMEDDYGFDHTNMIDLE